MPRVNLTKKDLINSIYMQIGFSKNISENLIDDFLITIIENLKEQKKLKLLKFGTFSVRSKKTRIGRNPKTKEQKIINSRDVRYTPVPQFNSSKTNLSQIPNNHDYYQLTYTAKNPQLMTEFSRSVRPFLSRYGRIINSKFTDLIIIQDTGVNLKRLYRLAQKFDNPLDDNLKDKFEKYEDQKFELKKLQSSNNCNHQDTYSKK